MSAGLQAEARLSPAEVASTLADFDAACSRAGFDLTFARPVEAVEHETVDAICDRVERRIADFRRIMRNKQRRDAAEIGPWLPMNTGILMPFARAIVAGELDWREAYDFIAREIRRRFVTEPEQTDMLDRWVEWFDEAEKRAICEADLAADLYPLIASRVAPKAVLLRARRLAAALYYPPTPKRVTQIIAEVAAEQRRDRSARRAA